MALYASGIVWIHGDGSLRVLEDDVLKHLNSHQRQGDVSVSIDARDGPGFGKHDDDSSKGLGSEL